jgi:transcriptional regulator GlxA family with amidase domain
MERSCRSRTRWPEENASRREIVERVEAYVRAHCEGPVPLSRLCRIVGLSERGLRNAFYSIRGTSPKRCILAQRLRRVRETLSDASTAATTVTDIATLYGFYELGRFAGCYKAAFGEAPSDTLRRRRRALQQTNTKRASQCLHEPVR